MKVSMEYMGTDALIRSYHIAHSSRNFALVEEIKQILTARGEAHKIPANPIPIKVEQKPNNSWNMDDW